MSAIIQKPDAEAMRRQARSKPFSEQGRKAQLRILAGIAGDIAAKLTTSTRPYAADLAASISAAESAEIWMRKVSAAASVVGRLCDRKASRKSVISYTGRLKSAAASLNQVATAMVNSVTRLHTNYNPANSAETMQSRVMQELLCLHSYYKDRFWVDLPNCRVGYITEDCVLRSDGVSHADEKGAVINFGKFAVAFSWGGSCEVLAAQVEEPWFLASGYQHPHVNRATSSCSSTECCKFANRFGNPCLGNGEMLVKNGIRDGRLVDALQTLEAILSTYNEESPYIHLCNCIQAARSAGRLVKEPVGPRKKQCTLCVRSVREENFSPCHSCQVDSCSGCKTTCPICRVGSYCAACIKRCGRCGSRSCAACLNSGVEAKCSAEGCLAVLSAGCGGCAKSTKCTGCGQAFCSEHLSICNNCEDLICLPCTHGLSGRNDVHFGLCLSCYESTSLCEVCQTLTSVEYQNVCDVCEDVVCDDCCVHCSNEDCRAPLCIESPCSVACSECSRRCCADCLEDGLCARCAERAAEDAAVVADLEETNTQESEARDGEAEEAAPAGGAGEEDAGEPEPPAENNLSFWSFAAGTSNELPARTQRYEAWRSSRG